MKNKQLNLGLKYPKLDISFREEEKVVTEKVTYVTVESRKYVLENLLSLLESVEEGGTAVHDDETGKHLLKIEVLKYLGSRRNCMAAEKGPAFNQLLKCLTDYYYKE